MVWNSGVISAEVSDSMGIECAFFHTLTCGRESGSARVSGWGQIGLQAGFTGHATMRSQAIMHDIRDLCPQAVSRPIAHGGSRRTAGRRHGARAIGVRRPMRDIGARPIRAACRSAGAHTVHPRHPIQHRRRRGQRGPRPSSSRFGWEQLR